MLALSISLQILVSSSSILSGGGVRKLIGGDFEKYSINIETVLSTDEVCRGRYSSGVFDVSSKAICTIGFVKPFVVSASLTSSDYRFCVTVYNSGAYVRTDGWFESGAVYEFDHDAYQYKMYIGRVDSEYVYDLDGCCQSVKLTISAADILKSYNVLEVKSDTERRNTRNAMEYMMRRNYDISYANAPAPLDLITYAGDNQIVHPKVLYFPNKFSKHRFWMAYNPYPRANGDYENPCIAYSDDGYEWTNIPENPLDDPGGYGVNTDVHLVYVEAKSRLEVWWRYVLNEDDVEVIPEIIYRRTSTDGLNWTEKEVIINNDSGDHTQYFSPCILHDGSKYKVWVANYSQNTIKYYEGMEETEAIPAEAIALKDEDMTYGAALVNGTISENTAYMHTNKIQLNESKSFSLTGFNTNGIAYHIPIRYIVAYDADGNRLSNYSYNTETAGGTVASLGERIITMNEVVDSVVLTLYRPEQYTEKTITLNGKSGGVSELTHIRDIALEYTGESDVAYSLWHLDVIEDDEKTVMTVMCKGNTQLTQKQQTWSLFLTTSDDNITFTIPKLVIVGNPYGWDKQIYRSSIVNVDGEYRIYYTAQDDRQHHGLGVCTSSTLSNFVGKW